MNRRIVTLLVTAAAVIGLTTTVVAQRAAPKNVKAPSKVQAQSVTLTGCVAQGIDADHYVLANAVRREQPPASSAVAGKVGSDKKVTSDRTGPYDLQGGEFKAHLGHTVAVTGTSGDTGKLPDTTTKDSDTERKPLSTFNVQSVKMLSATCS